MEPLPDYPTLFGRLVPLTTLLAAERTLTSNQVEEVVDNSVLAMQWRGDAFTLLLSDMTLLRWQVVEVPQLGFTNLHIDRSGASHLHGPSTCGAMDLNTGLLLVATSAADAASSAELVLLDVALSGVKARGGRVALPCAASSLALNCSGNMAAAHCGSSLLIFKLEQAGGADSDRRAWLGSPSKAGTKSKWSMQLVATQDLQETHILALTFSRKFPNVLMMAERIPPPPTLGLASGAHQEGRATWARALAVNGASVEPLHDTCLACEEGACGAATAVAWDAAEESAAVGTSSGWVLVYALEADQPPLRRLKLQERHAVCLVQWHPCGGVLVIGAESGTLTICTAALHPLRVWDPTRGSALPGPASPPCIALAQCVNLNLPEIRMSEWQRPAPCTVQGGSARAELSHAVLAIQGSQRSLVAVLQLNMGMASRGGLSVHNMVAHLLAEEQALMAVQVAAAASDKQVSYSALALIFHSLRRRDNDPGTEEILTKLVGIVAEAVRSNVSTNAEVAHQIAGLRNMCRSYCQQALVKGKVQLALTCALQILDISCLEDIYVHAIRHGSWKIAACVFQFIEETEEAVGTKCQVLSREDLVAFQKLQCELSLSSNDQARDVMRDNVTFETSPASM